jgi:hypothetical protein
MNFLNATENKAAALIEGEHPGQGLAIVALLRAHGLRLADAQADEMVCTWVSTAVRAVPPDADTIIRTITRTVGEHSWSTTHWLEGLRGPNAGPSPPSGVIR